jgi:hypothetical protein
MIRLSRVVIAAGAVVTLAACSEIAPTAPAYRPAAAATEDAVVVSAPAASASCTVTQNSTGYDVTVSWSGISATLVEVWGSDVNQPLAETILGHPTRKGSLQYTLTAAPVYAIVSGAQLGAKVLCLTGA